MPILGCSATIDAKHRRECMVEFVFGKLKSFGLKSVKMRNEVKDYKNVYIYIFTSNLNKFSSFIASETIFGTI